MVVLIYVTSSESGAGKTGVAMAIARRFAYLGRPVRLARLASSDHGSSAVADAALFGGAAFAPGSAGEPVSSVSDPGGEAIVVAEGEPSEAPSGAKIVLVARGAIPAAMPEGLAPAVIVVTALAVAEARRFQQPAGPPVVVIPEDRTLAGFSLDEARRLLSADLIVEGDRRDTTADHLVIAPIASDAGQPHFRRFPSQAVVVRFDKTDQHLAAMQGDPEFLILTGGRRPSDYLFDAAAARGMPVLLSRTDTENTVIALEPIFERTRFQGERKLECMAAYLEGSALYAVLAL